MTTYVYTPDYSSEVRTTRVTEQHNTWHRSGVDWTFPLLDLSHVSCMCSGDDHKRKHLQQLAAWLRDIEANREYAWASDYGGWPRIWQKVEAVGMASAWPYWRPRPTVLLRGPLGTEFKDWTSLTGVEIRHPSASVEGRGTEQ